MWYQPRFTSPTTWFAGTRTSSKKTSLKPWRPAMLMSGRTVTPGVFMSSMNMVMPLCFGRIRVGAGGEPAPVGEVAAGGPDLLAVDDVVVAIADGAGLEGGEVGAGARLAIERAPPVVGAGDAGDELRSSARRCRRA